MAFPRNQDQQKILSHLPLERDSDMPSPAEIAAVEKAISQATFILECMDWKWAES